VIFVRRVCIGGYLVEDEEGCYMRQGLVGNGLDPFSEELGGFIEYFFESLWGFGDRGCG
jgi:hypothetical protein